MNASCIELDVDGDIDTVVLTTVLPPDDNDNESSEDECPSMTFPIFCQVNKGGMAVGEYVGKYGDHSTKIGGFVITLFGRVPYYKSPCYIATEIKH